MAQRSAFCAGALASLMAVSVHAQSLHVRATVDTLPNGLRVIVSEDHSAPIVTVNTWFDVGSANEKPGRTGLAHLFEHLMFMGSQHAPYPQFDRLLEAAGANNNASTANDRTDYYEAGPANALPLMLWLDADRMGWFLPVMDARKVDAQRDVVKNERRQSVENQPYGVVEDIQPPLLFPAGHPYSWPVIGSMADLSAASLDDVRDFFRRYYAPDNAVLAVVGDVTRGSVLTMIRKYFGDIPRGPGVTQPVPSQPGLQHDTVVTVEDRVQLPRLYYDFESVRAWAPDDAALKVAAYILTGAKNSRLTQRLVYRDQNASNVFASPNDLHLAGYFEINATARPGHTLPELQWAIDAELQRLAHDGPNDREMQQARNSMESRMLGGMETIQGKANRLNQYYIETGNPDAFQKDVDRIRAVSAADVQRVVRTYLLGPRVILSVVPIGKAATPGVAATRRVVP
ncbi:MAG: M16 family metallopeptidase [Gemmatimonadales bacterium]